jgi:hypothetical protein
LAIPSLNPLAVIAGCAIDLGFTYLAGTALALGYLSARGVDFATARTTTEFLVLLISVGAVGTVLGGAIAARIARKSPIAHGLSVGGVSAAMGLLSLLGGGGSLPEPWNWLGVAAAVPAGLLGALIAAPRD